MIGEISYDLIMEDDMSFVEGAFRIGHADWQVFIFRKDPIEQIEVKSGHWASSVTGLFVRIPSSFCLNKQFVIKTLTEYSRVEEWREVRGPDSMQLR